MSSNDHPASAGNRDDPSSPASTGVPHESQQPPQLAPLSSLEPLEVHQTPTETENAQKGDQTTADAKPVDGGESASVPTSTQPNDTDSAAPTAAPSSTDVPQTESEEPKVAAPTTAQPVSEEPSDAAAKEVEENPGPSLTITLLLITGSRHPFKIDGKYLRKQSVNVENNDPFLMSVYTLKELIWREWRSDWETRPTSPSSIRLISFGKLLEDKAPLSDSKFNHDAPNVVHMTVKPQEIVDEEDAKGSKTQYSREREASERSPGCRCVIL